MKRISRDSIVRLLKLLPTGVPYLGDVISQYMTSEDLQEFKKLVENLQVMNETQYAELKSELGTHGERLEALKVSLSKPTSQEKITVVVPCGGTGGSLFPMTQVMPKCLVIVNEKPILHHILDSLYRCSNLFEKVIVTTGDYHAAIEQNVKLGGYGNFVECVHYSSTSLPHSLRLVREKIKTKTFLLHYNDILIADPRWEEVIATYKFHKGIHDQIGTLLCSSYYPLEIGVITEGKPGQLDSFVEKPSRLAHDKFANIAVAFFEVGVIGYCRDQDTSFFRETIQRLISDKKVILLHRVEEWFHVQDWNALWRLQHEGLFRPS